jgi:hypothetical protein
MPHRDSHHCSSVADAAPEVLSDVGADFEKPLGTRLCAARARPLSVVARERPKCSLRRGQAAGLFAATEGGEGEEGEASQRDR